MSELYVDEPLYMCTFPLSEYANSDEGMKMLISNQRDKKYVCGIYLVVYLYSNVPYSDFMVSDFSPSSMCPTI